MLPPTSLRPRRTRAVARFAAGCALVACALTVSPHAWSQTDSAPETTAPASTPTPAESTPIGATIPGLTLPAMATRAPEKGSHSGGSDAGYLPTQQTLLLIPGVNQIIPIAQGHLNRIITPFADPVVHTTSTAKISTEGSILYVSSSAKGPSTMYVSPQGNQQMALSLTLVPRAIPPREIRLKIAGDAAPVLAQPLKAGKWERSRPYIETIKQALSKLALGEVPPGYGLRQWQPEDPAIACDEPGIRVETGQVLSGAQFILLVGVATNTTGARLEIDESRCRHPGVLAVTAWPVASLPAEGKTELYVVMRRPAPAEDSRARPSLLNKGD